MYMTAGVDISHADGQWEEIWSVTLIGRSEVLSILVAKFKYPGSQTMQPCEIHELFHYQIIQKYIN